MIEGEEKEKDTLGKLQMILNAQIKANKTEIKGNVTHIMICICFICAIVKLKTCYTTLFDQHCLILQLDLSLVHVFF